MSNIKIKKGDVLISKTNFCDHVRSGAKVVVKETASSEMFYHEDSACEYDRCGYAGFLWRFTPLDFILAFDNGEVIPDRLHVGDIIRSAKGHNGYPPCISPNQTYRVTKIELNGRRFWLDRCGSGDSRCGCLNGSWSLDGTFALADQPEITPEEISRAVDLPKIESILDDIEKYTRLG